ncbi:hypothetical protein Leryth_006468 [Lithospermum erythrorhizon]|nr:hypothetical protein Leryth_006468 [Lithospermum erythrorhizon]
MTFRFNLSGKIKTTYERRATKTFRSWIGFKSVFLISSHPYIFSNGYKIRFSEQPCTHCNVGYVVPEWVEEKPTLGDLQSIYGSAASLPTTTIVLPLKADKVKPVQQQLSSIHPEILLFLSKIRQLSVREENDDPRHKTVSSISISSETDFLTKKNLQAESYLLHLSADDKGDQSEGECRYHMWRQRFPVKRENKVDRRMDVDDWVITLAFPFGERLLRGRTCPGIYAFLPTEMITNFPFIIQADFLLASSRETILLDNKWNKGILSCVHTAFVNAFTSMVKVDSPISSLLRVFNWLPVESSPFEELNAVRASIKEQLMSENIIPSESGTNQKYFHKPNDVSRLDPSFWKILMTAKKHGVSLHNISSHGRYILSSEFDRESYSNVLCFLGVDYVDDDWYSKCIQSSDMVLKVPEDVYLDILLFISSKWRSFLGSSMIHTSLLKSVDVGGQVTLCSVSKVMNRSVSLLRSDRGNSNCISWLISWNSVFGHPENSFFLPQDTQKEIMSHTNRHAIVEWLEKSVKVEAYSVFNYATLVGGAVGSDRRLAIIYAHFLYSSFNKNFLSKNELEHLCGMMPLVDNYGAVTRKRKGVLVPAQGSRWMQLIGSNPWRKEGFVELGEEYLHSCNHAGVFSAGKEVLNFLKSYVAASDVPELPPPDADLSCFFSLLKVENAILLLDWIRNIRRRGNYMPRKFSASVEQGSWLKVSVLGSAGFGAPAKSFFPCSKLNHLVQNGFVDIAFINVKFYGDQICKYKEELKAIGVKFEFGEACEYIGEHLTSLAESSTLSKDNVLSILSFIKLLRENYLPPESFINSVKGGAWLWTSQGYRSPMESVFYSEKWQAASEISNIPFVDQKYYGKEILSFESELNLLGVIFDLGGNYELVIDNMKPHPSYTSEAVLLILRCMHSVKNSSQKLIDALVNEKCFKTHMGYKSPAECFLFDPAWGSLMKVFTVFPVIDVAFYNDGISSYKDELHKLGVVVHMKQASQAFCNVFRQQASSRSIEKENALKLLGWYKELKGMIPEDARKCVLEVKKCICEVKWLKTRLGDYREPKECILHSSAWDPISSISLLPFIDDNYYGKSLHDFKEELQGMGVVDSIGLGAKFVAAGLRMPKNPTIIMPTAMVLLLQCVRYLEYDKESKSLLICCLTKLGQSWVKTTTGYKSPKECLLFGSDWNKFLQLEDGPFMDTKFYGSLDNYKNELAYLEVATDVPNGCQSIFANLGSYSNFAAINRIYKCLHHYNWKPIKDVVPKVWIPNGDNDGEWVNPEDCVLHDKHGLFNEQLHVLEKHYEKNLLSFFSSVFGVKANPSLDDYCKLWSDWESSRSVISEAECCAFWDFVVKHWSSAVTKVVLSEKLVKFPGSADAMSIKLVDKHDILIPDDLRLKDLFKQSTSLPLFIWYPPSLNKFKLNEIFCDIGVRTLSESVQKEEKSVDANVGLKKVDGNQSFITRGLIKLILGFLSSPSTLMEIKKRRALLESLLNAKLSEASEPILLSYKLQLSSGETVNAEMSQTMRWEKSSSMIYVQKENPLGGSIDLLEYAICASEVISEGLLWENEEHMLQLADLLKVGFLLEFDEAAIDLLMKTKNLEILPEDEAFLASAFPST